MSMMMWVKMREAEPTTGPLAMRSAVVNPRVVLSHAG